jgi:hypothetical protein
MCKEIFNEIYGKYFTAVSEILQLAIDGKLDAKLLHEVVTKHAFGESILNIPQSLGESNWHLLTDDFHTPLKHKPSRPITLAEKRWLKALLADPRLKLFGDFSQLEEGLKDVTPLLEQDNFVYFDRYADGDDYTNESYIKNFRLVLQALHEKRKVNVVFHGNQSNKRNEWFKMTPIKLEYSSKDDKFRLLCAYENKLSTINLSTIESITITNIPCPDNKSSLLYDREELILEVTDNRNTLDGIMMRFSHLEKQTERIDDGKYRVKLLYDKQDATEILIRIFSFGAFVKVVSPKSFIDNMKTRLENQRLLTN